MAPRGMPLALLVAVGLLGVPLMTAAETATRSDGSDESRKQRQLGDLAKVLLNDFTEEAENSAGGVQIREHNTGDCGKTIEGCYCFMGVCKGKTKETFAISWDFLTKCWGCCPCTDGKSEEH